jgi:Tfp pilus assembly protein PilZ
MPELRRERRVAYHARVRLRAPGREHSVIARVQNLSAGGAFVTAPEVPAAGTEVLCRMLVEGEARTLRGQVAWVRPPGVTTTPEGVGAGIRFVDLSQRDSEMLARIIEPDASERQSVDVGFEGLPAPIKSHAVIADESLQISTRLPFLRLRSTVRVSFQRRGVAEERVGTLESVTLEPSHEDGVPRLRLLVSTPQLESAMGVIDLPVGAVPEAAEGALLTEPLTIVDPRATEAPPPPRFDEQTQVIASRAAPARPAQRRWMWALAGAVSGATLVVALVVLVATRPVRRPPAPAPAIVAVEPPRPAVVQIEPLAHTPPPRVPQPPPSERAVTETRPAGVEIEEDGYDGGRMFVPCVGSLKGMQRYALADPPGLTVNLPRARPRVPAGPYALGAGVFRRLVVQRRGAGSQVRVYFAPDVAPDVIVEPGGLRITARPRRTLARRL